nr:hypothetical protein [Tanacetum cinerariifolium]
MTLPRRTLPPRQTPPAAVCRRLLPPSLPISSWNDRLPPALPYFSLITICYQPLLPYQQYGLSLFSMARSSLPLPLPLSLPSAKLNDLGFGGIRVPKQKRNTGTKEIEEASKDDDGRLLTNLAFGAKVQCEGSNVRIKALVWKYLSILDK